MERECWNLYQQMYFSWVYLSFTYFPVSASAVFRCSINRVISTFVKWCLILLERNKKRKKKENKYIYKGHFYCSEKYQPALWNNVLSKNLSACRETFYSQNKCSSFHHFEPTLAPLWHWGTFRNVIKLSVILQTFTACLKFDAFADPESAETHLHCSMSSYGNAVKNLLLVSGHISFLLK